MWKMTTNSALCICLTFCALNAPLSSLAGENLSKSLMTWISQYQKGRKHFPDPSEYQSQLGNFDKDLATAILHYRWSQKAGNPNQGVEAFIKNLEVVVHNSSSETVGDYLEYIELLQQAKHTDDPEVIRLLLILSAYNTEKDLQKIGQQIEKEINKQKENKRPYLVRREARYALIRMVTSPRSSEFATTELAKLLFAKPGKPNNYDLETAQRTGIELFAKTVSLEGFKQLIRVTGSVDFMKSAAYIQNEIYQLILERTGLGKSTLELRFLDDLRSFSHKERVNKIKAQMISRDKKLKKITIGMIQEFLEKEQEDLLASIHELKPAQTKRQKIAEDQAKRQAENNHPGTSSHGPELYGIKLTGRQIALVLDKSGSMGPQPGQTGETRFDRLKDEFQELVKTLESSFAEEVKLAKQLGQKKPKKREIAVVFFNDQIDVDKISFSSRYSNVYDGVEKTSPYGLTNLSGGVLRAFGYDHPGQPVNPKLKMKYSNSDKYPSDLPDQIIILSDGAPTKGPLQDLDDIEDELKRINPIGLVRVDVILIGGAGFSQVDTRTYEDIAFETGGSVKFVP